MGLLKKLALLIALLLIALVIWFGGPYLAFADYVPLESALARLILIGAIVLLWVPEWPGAPSKAARAGGQLAKAVARNRGCLFRTVVVRGTPAATALRRKQQRRCANRARAAPVSTSCLGTSSSALPAPAKQRRSSTQASISRWRRSSV